MIVTADLDHAEFLMTKIAVILTPNVAGVGLKRVRVVLESWNDSPPTNLCHQESSPSSAPCIDTTVSLICCTHITPLGLALMKLIVFESLMIELPIKENYRKYIQEDFRKQLMLYSRECMLCLCIKKRGGGKMLERILSLPEGWTSGVGDYGESGKN